ncbi:MAG: M48 family metalloprotease [Planctomycetota bacterium]
MKTRQAAAPAVRTAPAEAATPRRASAPSADGSEIDFGSLDLSLVKEATQKAAKKRGINALDNLAELNQLISKQLKTTIPHHGTSTLYRLGLSMMAAFMLMMPLAYALLVAGAGYGVYVYAFDVFPGLMSYLPRGRAAIFMLIIYATPIVCGCISVVFMVKPLFVSMILPADPRRRSIMRKSEPVLFHLVDEICNAAGSPKPTRIDVDCRVNASASFGSGLKSLFGNDLVLTIGIPLVSGLSSRQFAGVLAHEFGHFAQGAGMRASYVVRSINSWFARVVYQRDQIDEWLDDAITESESAFAIVLLLARFCVWLSRGILWCFMIVAHIGSSFMMRQMEFDADRMEAGLAGSDSFAATAERLRTLGFAQQKTHAGLAMLAQQEAVLLDNIPGTIVEVTKTLSHKEREVLAESRRDEKTGLFDSHPCDTERIDAARELEQPGLFTIDVPARNLFRNFAALCCNVTQDFYRNQLGRMVEPTELKPFAQHVGKISAMQPS